MRLILPWPILCAHLPSAGATRYTSCHLINLVFSYHHMQVQTTILPSLVSRPLESQHSNLRSHPTLRRNMTGLLCQDLFTSTARHGSSARCEHEFARCVLGCICATSDHCPIPLTPSYIRASTQRYPVLSRRYDTTIIAIKVTGPLRHSITELCPA